MANVIPLPRSESLNRQLRAGLYGRASQDRYKLGRSIRDQFTVAEIEVEERGWTIVGHYEDRDRSATRKATKVREDFERLVADAEAGHLDVIVYAERSRISRNLNVSLQLRDLCMRTGVLLCYDGRVYDMRRGPDFKEFTRDAVQSEEEGEVIIARNQRTARLQAKRGAPSGRLAFGFKREYDPDTGEMIGQVAHPVEAPVVRKMFKEFARGKSLKALLPLIQPLRPSMGETGVRVILRNKAYIGIRVHFDDEYEAAWDGIVKPDLFWQVRAIMDDPERRTSRDYDLKHLLASATWCSNCRLTELPKRAKLKPRCGQPKHGFAPRYSCPTCHVSINQEKLEAFIEESVLEWLLSARARDAFRRDDAGDELAIERTKFQAMSNQLAEARERASSFDEVTGMPGLSAGSLASMEQKVIPLMQASEARIRQLMASGDPVIDQLMQAVSREDLDEIWEDKLSVAQQRDAIRSVVRVEVRPAKARGSRQPVGTRAGLIFIGEPGFKEWPASSPELVTIQRLG